MKTQTKKQSVASSAVQPVTATHTENGMRKYRFTWCGLGIWFVMVMLMAASPSARAQLTTTASPSARAQLTTNAFEHFNYSTGPINGKPGNSPVDGWLTD